MRHRYHLSLFFTGLIALFLVSNGHATNTFPASGYVGIGTTSPGYVLDVYGGAIHSDTGLVVGDGYWSTEGMSHLAITTYGGTEILGNTLNVGCLSVGSWTQYAPYGGLYVAGNVGIGTTSIGQTLDVANSSYIQAKFESTASGEAGGIQLFGYNGSSYQQFEIQSIPSNGSPASSLIIYDRTHGQYDMTINAIGYVGIGTTNPTYPLAVNGTVEAKEVLVQTGWSDYVFDKNYKLPTLDEVAKTIQAQKHLPGMPSAKEVAEHGVKMGEMEAKLLAQIEEITLRQITEEKRADEQSKRIDQLEKENTYLRSIIR